MRPGSGERSGLRVEIGDLSALSWHLMPWSWMEPTKEVVLNLWSMNLNGRRHLCFRYPLTSISFNNESNKSQKH